MPSMRAKMKVAQVTPTTFNDAILGEQLQFSAVSRNDGYPVDGSDENNTFAQFTPSADLSMYVNNPALFNQFKVGQEFYVDFTEVPVKKTFGSAVR